MTLRLYAVLMASALAAADHEPPALTRVHPLGGRAGSIVEVEILGAKLEGTTGVEFDSRDLVWEQTTLREAGRVKGVVSIGRGAAPGGHMLRAITAQGPSTSLLFNVGQYPAFVEGEQRALPSLPAEIYGRLDGAADIDTYWFSVNTGERWVFDLQAMEHGSAVEARMILIDRAEAKLAYNDDRDAFNENPLIEHTFAKSGIYGVRLDQYRGPRGFTFGKNNGYVLRVSQLPRVRSVAPLGARRGGKARFVLRGSGFGGVSNVYLTEVRRAEYARMTYPYTMPIRFGEDTSGRVDGKVISRADEMLEAAFVIPEPVSKGLWKLWLTGPAGVAEGLPIEIGDDTEFTEGEPLPERFPFTVNGSLLHARERDLYRVAGRKGVPIHISTLSAQLGGPLLDTVLTLRDAAGKKVAENDDVVAGWGGLLGNPDSSLFYTPLSDGPLQLEVRDRLNRGGELFPYRLKFDSARPGFQLFTTPENFSVRRGGTAVMKVHLVREAGFAGEVDVWVEGLPGLRGRFRADQFFEPNADGADMLIPEMELRAQAPEKTGVYPVRVFGRAVDGRVAEGHTATMIGPIYQGDWNFFRRPVPEITLTVVE
ncbi:MAG: hypothetical protein HYX27_06385 [Acidobacteria bacterium]|nr:hypothetical protein [Acidobacteriota bacterium]